MSFVPELPDAPPAMHGEAPLVLRYEDLCQDGRMMTIAMPVGLGALWRSSKSSDSLPIWELRKQGIVPILSHLWISASEEPIHLTKKARCCGDAIVAHTVDEQGEVDRLLLDMQVSLFGTRGRMFGSQPENAGEEVLVGKVYARHVFTRPFAPRDQRRVTSFEGLRSETQVVWTDLESFRAIPENARVLDTELEDDAARVAFALHHCDSNQHVNSLAYPKLFEDAAQRRFADRQARTHSLSRDVAIAFRKPFFAGQRARLRLQSFEEDEELGAVGGFYSGDGEDAKAHCHLRMNFR